MLPSTHVFVDQHQRDLARCSAGVSGQVAAAAGGGRGSVTSGKRRGVERVPCGVHVGRGDRARA
eukprot:5798180-Prymnesium_polylepis.1